MSSPYSDDLKSTFDKCAHLQREAEKTLTPSERVVFQKLTEKHDGRMRFERRRYELEYKTRVEVARKELIDQAGSKGRTFIPIWGGADRFDKAAIDRQAHRQVRHNHEKLMGRMNEAKAAEQDAFLDQCHHRRQQREKPRRDFARAADRRSGLDRRVKRVRD
jgi:hypothetical protein